MAYHNQQVNVWIHTVSTSFLIIIVGGIVSPFVVGSAIIATDLIIEYGAAGNYIAVGFYEKRAPALLDNLVQGSEVHWLSEPSRVNGKAQEQVRLFLEVVGSCFEVWKRLTRAEVRRGLTIEDITTDFLEEARNEQRESAFASKQKEAQNIKRKKQGAVINVARRAILRKTAGPRIRKTKNQAEAPNRQNST
ncbi:hypothetical protein V1524DRAFT_479897 [Lipomyces starkeyi]